VIQGNFAMKGEHLPIYVPLLISTHLRITANDGMRRLDGHLQWNLDPLD
jgi:hypothetical protein